jgi:hypothetical protein
MVEWLKRLVAGEGNVMQERSYTDWNTLDVASILEAKLRETREAGEQPETSMAAKSVPGAHP